MKALLATTALGLMIAGPALAQVDIFVPDIPDSVRATDFMGKRVYVSEADIDPAPMNDASGDWDDIGEIGDVVISRAGDVEAVLVDVGGFLGIGEKTVAVNMGALTLVPDGDSEGDYFIVFKGNQAGLEGAPAFAVEGGAAADTHTTGADTATTVPAVDATTAPGTATPATPGAAGAAQDFTGLTAEQLTGAAVMSTNGDKIGDVADLVLGDNDVVTHVIVDVGGFLGICAKSVALAPDKVTVTQNTTGNGVQLVVEATEDQLTQLPEFSR